MFEISNIDFLSSYICTLDTNFSNPQISNYDIENDDDISLSFIENSILNLYSSKDMKWARFSNESPSTVYELTSAISKDLSNFKSMSREIVHEYFAILANNYEVPNGQLIVTLFEMENVAYMGFFKYNYKTMLTSKVEQINESRNITINRESSLFTTSRHKADEGFIVHLPHMDICIVDKKYNINGEKSYILKDTLLLCATSYSEKEKLSLFSNVTKNIEKKYLLDDAEKKAQLKKIVKDNILDNGYISVNDVIQNSFEDSPQLQKIYESSLEKTGLKRTDNIEVDQRTLKTRFQTQKISTENGISIDIPIDYYGDDSKLEFIPNDDGTISIIIKNIKHIIS